METLKKIDNETLEITITHKQTIKKQELEERKKQLQDELERANEELAKINKKLSKLA